MMPEPEVPRSPGPTDRSARLESLIAVLVEALDGLDALEICTAATHVSMGIELAKSDLEKLRNEANPGVGGRP